jgi:hypothetical protein
MLIRPKRNLKRHFKGSIATKRRLIIVTHRIDHILTPLIHFLCGAQDREVYILRLNILESTFPKIQDINFPKLLELFHLDLEM